MADLVGFKSDGVWVALSTGRSFAPATLWSTTYSAGSGGWSSYDLYPRALGDVDGSGRAAIVGFGGRKTYVTRYDHQVRMYYDADGARVRSVADGQETVYVGDWVESGVMYYYFGGQRVARANGHLGPTAPPRWTLLHDHLGSATQAISDTTGTATTQRYYPYGAQRGGGEVNTPYRYTGQKWEENDALQVYYYKARWYDPALRRFLQPDTIVPNAGDPQSLNRYSYAANSPISNSDPTGHAVFSDVGAHLLYNPVNNNVMVRDISGSGINRVIAQASVGSASASDRLAAILAGTMGFFGWQRGFLGKLDTLLGKQIRTQFRGAGGVVGDAGFAPEFQDDHWYATVWGNRQLPTSRQTGHFLTAVRMGVDTDRDWIRAIVGHEQWSDKWSKGGPVLQLALKGRRVDQDRFVDALAFDASGQVQIRDALLLDILSPERHGALDLRQGNSIEDLRLSARGWRLGRMVAEGSIHTNKELANWIALNVAGDRVLC